uniref:Uncharacterized protein n=1 Tax=Ditylenchus dipsaci TaxID=166011 RepID=A0A915DHP6_9BILA
MKLFLGAFNDSFTSIIGCVKVLNFGDYSQGTKEIPEIISSYKLLLVLIKFANNLQTQMKNDTEDVVEQQEQATTKELGAR